MHVIRLVFWSLIAIMFGAFGMAVGSGLGVPEPAIWMSGLWLGWGVMFTVFLDGPVMRWVAKALFNGEIDPRGRQIKGPIYASERGIIRLRGDTSTLEWKTCLLTLIHIVWIAAVNLFMVLMVFRHLATWLAERI